MALAACGPKNETPLTSYVNPLIGSGGHGHVFVGASVPFGMVQLGPTSITQTWDWCSGYHQDEQSVIGFSHTHLSGTGIGDLFDVTVMPVVGEVVYERGTLDNPASGMWSEADRTKEVAVPGYYSVPLKRYGITAEVTATERVGYHRYTFPAASDAALVFDLQNGGCWDKTMEAQVEITSDSTLCGYRFSKGWAKNQRVYFAAELSKPFASVERGGQDSLYTRLNFATTDGEQVLLKVAISSVSTEGAELALREEGTTWDFDAVCQHASKRWNEELATIAIETPDTVQKRLFYTALYHSMMAPVLFSDINGDYRGANDSVYNAAEPRFTNFSLWDTYRAKQPLMTIVQPKRAAQFVNSMIDICHQQGRLPVWHLWGNETDCMVGDPAIPIVADAIVKQIPGVDREAAYQAILRTLEQDGRGRKLRREYGYIPCDLFQEAIAYDMEYALADGAAANAAYALGYTDEAEVHDSISHSYRKYFDASTQLIRGVDSKGAYRTPFNPYFADHRENDYCEGNAWQYTWLVPHDVEGYAENCFGSAEAMVQQLDTLFLLPSEIPGHPSPDISGLIGQFAHGNEPSHHILYLYTMLGAPEKTAQRVREVLATQYRDSFDGLSGNEDMGQMSAWYVLSALGFYQVEPAGARYWFGSPSIPEATLKVAGGNFIIEARNANAENIYIQSVELNGQPYTLPYIEHIDIAAGGKLVFVMGSEPAKWY